MNLVIAFDPQSPLSLQRQLCENLRRLILTGKLLPSQRLPSTRELATSLGISRNTAIESYEQLKSEGYLQTIAGSGTFVCQQLPDDLGQPLPATEDSKTVERSTQPQLSIYGASLTDTEPFTSWLPESPINFCYGRPALDQVPLKQWSRLWSRYCRMANRAMLDYAPDSLGYQPLREAIAQYLARSRSVKCHADQVIIVNGSLQAVNLVARVLIERGDWIAIEEPGFIDIRRLFQAQGAQLLPISVDESGIVVEHLLKASKPVLLHVTPSHQSPRGVVLSLPRRLELLTWAAQTGATIIEEDFDSEYRYSGRPVPALQGLDRSNAVIYVKDFSEVLFPALRIGYLVVPPPLVHVLARANWLAARQAPLLEQHVLTDFINEGHLERHVRRMRSLYSQRRRTLVEALTHYLGQIEIISNDAGMHLTVRFHTGLSDAEIIERAASLGFGLSSTRPYYLGGGTPGEFLLGYADLSEDKLVEGVERLAKVLT